MGNGIDNLLQMVMLYNAHVRVSCKSLGILYKYIFTRLWAILDFKLTIIHCKKIQVVEK